MEYCCTQTRLASSWEGSTDCTGSRGWSSYRILHTAVAENEKVNNLMNTQQHKANKMYLLHEIIWQIGKR